MAFVRPTPNKEEPKPTPSSLAPFLMTAPLRCATVNLAWPAGTTCSSTTGGLLTATTVTLHPDAALHFYWQVVCLAGSQFASVHSTAR